MKTRNLVAVLVLALSTPLAAVLPQPLPKDPEPGGWTLFRAPGESDLECASRSRRHWEVSLSPAGLETRQRESVNLIEPLPFEVDTKSIGVFQFAHRRVLSTDDGWLVGFSGGEFGGGLWWFSKDGAKKQNLSRDNVVSLINSDGHLFALAAIVDAERSYGEVRTISKQNEGWRSTFSAQLSQEPYVGVATSGEAFLVATTGGLVRLSKLGQEEQLTSEGYLGLYPSSMVETKTGTLYLGMRHFVAKLIPAHHGYRTQWLVRADCQQFSTGADECICKQ